MSARRLLRQLLVLRRAVLPAVILFLGTPNPVHAAISTASATHTYFLTSVSPFTQRTFTDTSSGLFTYDLTKSTGTGDITTGAQEVQVTANTIAAQLAANTQGAGAIARSTLELRFTLTDPAQLSLTGNAQGPGQDFSGGYSLSLRRTTDPANTFLLSANGFAAANWASLLPNPLPLTPGNYDLRMVASISGGAVGSTTNHALLQLAGNPALAGDYNDSDSVEQGDLDLVLNNWGSGSVPNLQGGLPGAVPEPAAPDPGSNPATACAAWPVLHPLQLKTHDSPRSPARASPATPTHLSPTATPTRTNSLLLASCHLPGRRHATPRS